MNWARSTRSTGFRRPSRRRLPKEPGDPRSQACPWRPVPGTTLEFVADKGIEAATGTIDRTLTLRIALRTSKPGGIRYAAWATRALDDRAEAMRVGLGLDYAF